MAGFASFGNPNQSAHATRGKPGALYVHDLTEINAQPLSDTLTVRWIRPVEVANLTRLDVVRHRLHRIRDVADEPVSVVRF